MSVVPVTLGHRHVASAGHELAALAAFEFIRAHGGEIPLGILRTVVPAAPDACLQALERWGTMSFRDVAARAIRCAQEGFLRHQVMIDFVRSYADDYRQFPDNMAIWLPGGAVPALGTRLVQADLARTLRFLCDEERAAGNALCATPSDPSWDVPVVPGTGLAISSRGSQSWAVRGQLRPTPRLAGAGHGREPGRRSDHRRARRARPRRRAHRAADARGGRRVCGAPRPGERRHRGRGRPPPHEPRARLLSLRAGGRGRSARCCCPRRGHKASRRRACCGYRYSGNVSSRRSISSVMRR